MPLPKQHTYTSEDYWNLPDGERAELIDGQLYNMAPPSRIHQRLVSQFTRVTVSTSPIITAPVRSILPHLLSIWTQTMKTGLNRIYPLSATTASSQTKGAAARRTGSWKLYRRPAAGWITPSKHDLFRCRRPGILDRRSCEATYHRVSLRRRCSSDDLSVRSTGCRWNLR